MTVESWTTESVVNCLLPVSVAGKTKVQARDYKSTGRFPVIDQGQEQIAGWTDDESAVVDSPLPLVVFGDHTRTFKFLDVPFARGADGTQLLRPKPGIDPLFFFYACRAIDLPARGYNRHFTILKEKELSYPVADNEQKAIAAVLRQTELALSHQSALLETLHELKRAAMARLFTRGLRGEAQQETEVGLVPESWEVAALSEVATLERGRFTHRPRNEPRFYGGTTPFIQTGDVVRSAGHINKFSQTLNGQGVAISRVFNAGTILITIAANIGYSGILEFDAACPDSLVAITPSEKLSNLYLNYYLQTQQPKMDQEAPKGTQKNINIQFLSPWPVPVPSCDEQREIVAVLDALDRKIALHREKRAVLEGLFQSLLRKLMIGEIRATDLDLSAVFAAPEQATEATA
jgi:type I restriction enzyme S subunit